MKRWIPLTLLLIAMAGFWLSGVGKELSTDSFFVHKDQIQTYINNHFIMALILYFLLYMGVVALSLPFASFLTMAGGFLFGFLTGTVLVAIAATIGATIIFIIAKGSLGKTLREKAGPLYKKVETKMNDDATSYMLFMRLVPLFPFFLVNIIPALFNVRTRTYTLTTFFGILPGTAVLVNVGQSLGEVENPADLISLNILISFALLGFFALIPVLYKKIRKRQMNHAR